MDLEYKQDWDLAAERWIKWWNHEKMDHPLLGIVAPQKKISASAITPPKKLDPESWWLDFDKVLTRYEIEFTRTVYLGEAFPSVSAYLGAGSMATFLGATPLFDYETIWYKPCFEDIRTAQLQFSHKSRWWQWTISSTRKAIERSQERYLVAIPDLIENLDTLEALLGAEKLLYAIHDHPKEIHRLQKQLLPLWFEAFEELYKLVKTHRGGNAFVAFQVWAPGRMAKLQCDLSPMISPDTFVEFVLPYLREQCDWLDYSLYHLDGSNAICHLDSVLSINSLDCIQWSPEPGQPSGGDPVWDRVYKKVLDAGKNIHATMETKEVKDFVKRFGSRGIYIRTFTSTEEEGRKLIQEISS